MLEFKMHIFAAVGLSRCRPRSFFTLIFTEFTHTNHLEIAQHKDGNKENEKNLPVMKIQNFRLKL